MLTRNRLLLRVMWLSLVAVVVFFTLELTNFYWRALPIGKDPIEFEVKSGSSLRQIAKQLQQQRVLSHPQFFVVMARLMGKTHRIQAGEYQISQGQTASQLLDNLIQGRVLLRNITIVPGWTIDKVLDEFHGNAYLKHDLKGLTRKQIREKLSIKHSSMEGLFWADTFSFVKNTDESALLIKAHQMMMDALSAAWDKRDIGLLYQSRYDALIVASLVEKETAIDQERPIIAGVILRRIKQKMYLQIDPTVIYALGDHYDGVLTRVDLKVNSPYNTYLNKGLPPTPIAIPSLASIEAAVHPDKGDALYFVANGNGRHIFSATLVGHNEAVKKVRAERNKEQR